MKFLPFVALAVIVAPAAAADSPHWRGPTRDGRVAEPSGWDGKTWPLEVAWKADVGEGNSSPVVVGDTVYLMGYRDKTDTVFALNAATGQARWKQSYPAPKYGRNAVGDESFYSGPSSTPEYDPATKLLYTLGCDGELRGWDTAAEGKLVWKVSLYDTFQIPRRPKVTGSQQRDYGFTSSPLVMGDRLIVEVGAKEGTLIAFDKKTGKVAWKSAANDPPGHNGGPLPMTVADVPCVAVLHHFGLLVVRTDGDDAGKTVAAWPWETAFSNNIASPTVVGDQILLTSNYNKKKVIRLSVGLTGAKKVWEQPYSSKVCSPVVHDGRVYWAWAKLYCLDWETGKLLWDKPGFTDPGSCLMTADHRLVVYSGKGRLSLHDVSAKGATLATHTAHATEFAWPHVVLSGGRYYCRDRGGRVVALAAGN